MTRSTYGWVSLGTLLFLASVPCMAAEPVTLKPNNVDSSCSPWRPMAKDELKVGASSNLCEGKLCHSVGNLLDGNDSTAWCEGAPGSGVGEWIEFQFAAPVLVDGFFIAPFYAKDRTTMFANARLKTLEVVTDEGSVLVGFSDQKPEETFVDSAQFSYAPVYVLFYNPWPHYKWVSSVGHSVKTKSLRLIVRDVFPGAKYQDLCISSVNLGLTKNRDRECLSPT
jgi:hypothetical protein